MSNEMRRCFTTDRVSLLKWVVRRRNHLQATNTPVCWKDDEDVVVIPALVGKAC